MEKKHDMLLIGVLLGQLLCLLVTVALVYARYPNNHWGADIRWAHVLGIVGLSYGLFLLLKTTRKTSAFIVIFASLLFIVLIYCTDKFNVLVHYDRSVQRGMPASALARTGK